MGCRDYGILGDCTRTAIGNPGPRDSFPTEHPASKA